MRARCSPLACAWKMETDVTAAAQDSEISAQPAGSAERWDGEQADDTPCLASRRGDNGEAVRRHENIIARIAQVFLESLHVEVSSADTDLFESGILDSLQLVDLLSQLEEQFGCRIAMEALDLEDLRTLRGLARIVAAHGGSVCAP